MNQICKLIPAYLVPTLAREFGVDKKARMFSPWSHVVTLLFAHIAHASSLNDVCDAIKTHETWFTRIRRAKAPSKNALSHDNRRAREMCADLKDGEIALFDKADVDFSIYATCRNAAFFG